MSFVWDEDKNKNNIKDHGIPFTLAAAVFDDEYRLEFFDEKPHTAEEFHLAKSFAQRKKKGCGFQASYGGHFVISQVLSEYFMWRLYQSSLQSSS